MHIDSLSPTTIQSRCLLIFSYIARMDDDDEMTWFIACSSWMLDCTWNIKTRAYNTKLQYTCHSQYTVV